MTKRNASPGDFHVALCQGVAIADGAPEWVHLMPAGVSQTVNGTGPFVLDATAAEAVIDASRKSSPDGKLVIDLNHSTDLAAPNGQPSPAQGWIEALEHRTDGLYGRVAWTDAGRTALNDRAYRFISPVVTYAKSTGKVIALLRASLTNNPNILSLKPVLNATNTAATTETDMDLLKALNALLGLPETGDAQAALAGVTALKSATTLNAGAIAKIAKAAKLADDADAETVLNAVTALADPAKMVPAATVTELQTALNTASARIKSLEDGASRKAAEIFVDGEIAKGRIGMKQGRDHFIAQHMANAADAEKLIKGFPLMAGEITYPAAGGDAATTLNAAEAQVAQLLGIAPSDFAATRTRLEGARS